MAKSAAFANAVLLHWYQNADIALIGDAAGLQNSATEGSLYVGLHEGDPGTAGDQTTNETAYGSYARQAVARNSSNWGVSANVASNVNAVNWPTASSGSGTLTHYAIGTAVSGAGFRLASGALTTSIPITAGVTTPQAAAGQITHTET